MPTDRRTFLVGTAAAAAALAGCSGDGNSGPRPPREDPSGNGEDTDPNGDAGGDTPAYIYTPNVAEWRAQENADGNLTLEVDLQSIHPEPTEGTMRIYFETTDGEETYTRPVEVDSEGTTTTTVDLPVRYDEYTINMSLPAFSFRNVTERSER
jgi:hypothetical protein